MGKAIRSIMVAALAVALSLTGLAGLGRGTAAAATGWLTGWTSRIQLTIDHNKVNSSLSSFPVLIHLSQSSGTNSADVSAVFNALGSNSEKIAVTTADGTSQCYVEIARWDSANKQAYLWTSVPSVSSSADTVLYLYYDNSQPDNTSYVGPTGSAAAENVWDSHFVAVWHLAQNGNGSAGQYLDSTRNHHNGQGGSGLGYGTPTLSTSSDGGPGVEQYFNGSNDYISVPDANGFSITTTGQLTVSAWMSPAAVNQPTSTGGYTRWIGKSTNNNIEWQSVYYNSNYIDSQGVSRSQWISWYNYSPSGGAGAGDYSTGNFAANSWVYVTGESTSSSATQGNEVIYRNAAVQTGNPDSWQSYGLTYANTSSPVTIGTGWLGSGNWWYGRLGEVRISNITRSSAWVAASYYADSDSLMTYGAPQTTGSSGPTTTPPSVTTNAASSITTSGGTLGGSLTSLGSASSDTVSFQYGPTTSYGSTTSSQTMTSTGAFSAPVSGLAPGTTYHFRAAAIGTSTVYGSDQTFTTNAASTPPPSGPSTTFGLSSGDSVDTCSLLNAQRFQNTVGSGTLTKLEVLVNDTTPSGNLELGIYADNNGSPGKLLLDAGSVPAVNGWVGISGLHLPVTANTYYWLAFLPQNPTGIEYQSTGTAANSHDCYAYSYGPLPTTSSIVTVNSTPFVMRATVSTSTPPSVTTNAASSITTSGATLNGNLSNLGSASSDTVSFQYGPTTSYGSTTSSQTMTSTGAFSAPVSGLAPGTTYHFRTVAAGDGTSYGSDRTFTTPALAPPSVTTNAATDVLRASATLNGTLTSLGSASSISVTFQYGTTTYYGSGISAETMTATGTFSVGIGGLERGTTYHYRAVAVGAGGIVVYGTDQTFTTNETGKP